MLVRLSLQSLLLGCNQETIEKKTVELAIDTAHPDTPATHYGFTELMQVPSQIQSIAADSSGGLYLASTEKIIHYNY